MPAERGYICSIPCAVRRISVKATYHQNLATLLGRRKTYNLREDEQSLKIIAFTKAFIYRPITVWKSFGVASISLIYKNKRKMKITRDTRFYENDSNRIAIHVAETKNYL